VKSQATDFTPFFFFCLGFARTTLTTKTGRAFFLCVGKLLQAQAGGKKDSNKKTNKNL